MGVCQIFGEMFVVARRARPRRPSAPVAKKAKVDGSGAAATKPDGSGVTVMVKVSGVTPSG